MSTLVDPLLTHFVDPDYTQLLPPSISPFFTSLSYPLLSLSSLKIFDSKLANFWSLLVAVIYSSLLALTGELHWFCWGFIQSFPLDFSVPSFFFPTPCFLTESPYSISFFLCSAVFSFLIGPHFLNFVSFLLLLNRFEAPVVLLSKSTFSLPKRASVPAPYPPNFLLLTVFSSPLGSSKMELFHFSSYLLTGRLSFVGENRLLENVGLFSLIFCCLSVRADYWVVIFASSLYPKILES